MRGKVMAFLAALLIVVSGFGGLGLGLGVTEVRADERTIIWLTYDGTEHYYDAETVHLLINGEAITYFGGDMPPIILEGRLYLPVRDTFELMGGVVTWNEAVGQAYINCGGMIVALRNDSLSINVNGFLEEIPLPPRIINGRMMAPVSFIADAFGFYVQWIEETRTVILNGEALPEPTPEATQDPFGGVTGSGFAEASYSATISAIDENVGTGPKALELSIDADPLPLPAQDNPKTDLTSIEFNGNDPNVFYIHTSSPVSRVEKMLLYDNRLALDFYNCEKVIPETELLVEGSSLLRRVRIGQNQVTPEMITRVVFDLEEPISYSVTLSGDRETVIVTFHRNMITNVTFHSDGTFSDYVYIYGDMTPVVNVYPQTVEGTYIIEIPLGIVTNGTDQEVSGRFVNGMRTEQFSPAAARILLDMGDTASYEVSYEEGLTIVRLFKPTYQNIEFDSYTNRLMIPKLSGMNLDIAKIVQSDDYLNFQYSFVFPGDFSTFLGEGNYIVKNNYINYINVSTVSNRTCIRFYEQQVMAFELTEDENFIYINAMLPKAKYDKIVIIDPGHGGQDPGTNGNGLVEKDVNLDIAVKLVKLLENSGVKAYMTRTSDTYPTRGERAAFANGLGDLFISIHNNYNPSTTANGTEVYYYHHENDALIGFSSERAAKAMQNNIVAALGSRDREYKENDYEVLCLTEIPAVLCEYGFLSNAAEAAKLKTDEYRQKCATGTFNGIMEIFRLYTPRR